MERNVQEHDYGWPPGFPANCPPADAKDASGTVYRWVASDPPTKGDFQPHVLLYPDREWSNTVVKHGCSELCMAWGCSVLAFANPVEARTELRRLAASVSRFRGMKVARGKLGPGLGKMKHTPSQHRNGESHHTLWLWHGVDPSPCFAVMRET